MYLRKAAADGHERAQEQVDKIDEFNKAQIKNEAGNLLLSISRLISSRANKQHRQHNQTDRNSKKKEMQIKRDLGIKDENENNNYLYY